MTDVETKVWFVEVPRSDGSWAPQLLHGDRPSSRSAEGASKRFRAEPVEVNPRHLGMSLTKLQEIYRPDISEPE